VNRCPDCPRNRFPGCCPGCPPSRCPRCSLHRSTLCSLHRSTRCSPGRSDHCGLSRRPRCSPRSSDRCSPGCLENRLPSCPPSCPVHCCPDCRYSYDPGQTFEGASQRPNPYHTIRLAPPRAGFTARRADRRARAGGGLWTAGAQLPLSPIRWPERRQPCCRTPKQLPLHDDLADARRL
jgi:hypothetical protein